MGFTGKQAMKWKIDYLNLFNKMRMILLKSQNDDRNTIEWKNQRAELKDVRLGLCKAIKEFTEYAEKQGSKHADYYYSHITIACNNALHNVNSLKKINKNLRDELDRKQVIKMQSLEIILEDKLVALLKQGLLNYKEIFQKLKEICIKYADVIGMQKPRYITEPEYKKCMNGKQLKIFNVQQKQLELFENRKMIS
jgi:phage regulator Rha-like protein